MSQQAEEYFTVTDEPDRTVPEDHIVRGRLLEIKRETVTPKDTSKEPWDKLNWWFEVTEQGLYCGRKIKGQTSPKFTNHPMNKAKPWAEALLQRELPVGVAIGKGDLEGLPCDFTVRWEKDRVDPNRIWERVDEVLPADVARVDDAPPF